MNNLEYLILFSSVLLGGGLGILLTKRRTKDSLQLVLSFSGAYILGITALHILPGIFSVSYPYTGIWILVGFFVQLVLEQLSQGVEHGHIHAHQGAKTSYAAQILLGLCLHALIEGVPLNNYTTLTHLTFNHLLYGIVLHKIPASFALAVLLLSSGFKKTSTLIALVVFAMMSPIGAWSFSFVTSSPEVINYSMALVAGSFLHVATTILFETDSSRSHKISGKKFIAIIFGLILAFLTMH